MVPKVSLFECCHADDAEVSEVTVSDGVTPATRWPHGCDELDVLEVSE